MTPEQRIAFRKGDLLGAGMGATELTGGRPVTTQVCTHSSLLSGRRASPPALAFTASACCIAFESRLPNKCRPQDWVS